MSGEVICIDSDSDEAPPQLFSSPADVSFLSECFPDIARTRLLEALTKAHGNVDAAVQFLTQVSRSPPNSPAVDPHDDVLDLSHDLTPVELGEHCDGNVQSSSGGERTDREIEADVDARDDADAVDEDDNVAGDGDEDDNDDEGNDEDGNEAILSDRLRRKDRDFKAPEDEMSDDDALLRPLMPRSQTDRPSERSRTDAITKSKNRSCPRKEDVAAGSAVVQCPASSVGCDAEFAVALSSAQELQRKRRESAKRVRAGRRKPPAEVGANGADAEVDAEEASAADAGQPAMPKRRRLTEEEKIERARKKDADRERKLAERAAVRLEKARRKAEQQRKAIADSFERFESQSLEAHRGEIAIILPEEMTTSKEGKIVLAMFRAVFPNQLFVEWDLAIANGVLWRRRVPRVDVRRGEFRLGDELEFTAVCFEAALFCQHIENGTIEGLVRHVFRMHPGKRVEFVVQGAELYCKRAAHQASRNAAGGTGLLVSAEAVRDCCMMLYMEYGVTTRHVKDADELSDYLVELTDSLANAPHTKASNFLDANAGYRPAQAGWRSAGAVNNARVDCAADLCAAGARAGADGAGSSTDGPFLAADAADAADAAAADAADAAADADADADADVDADGDAAIAARRRPPALLRVEDGRDYGVMFLNWLSTIPGVSLDKAKAVRAAHGTLGRLLGAYAACGTDAAREALLADVRFGAAGRRVGPVTARVIARALTSRDPEELVRAAPEV